MVTVCLAKVKGSMGGLPISGTIYFSDMDDAMASLTYDVSEAQHGDEVTIKLKMIEMAEKKYLNLPEFEGF